MFKSYFNNLQLSLLVVGLLCYIFSLIFNIKEKERASIILLLFSALFVFSFAALLDPFLNLWDERFHALVAKNLMNHPMKPTLYDDPVVKTTYYGWAESTIWLHKQPLFLWQITLCFKLFGVSEFSLRIPDIILGTILVYIGYRSGKILINRNVGFITASLILSSTYILELVSGREIVDHNDLSFVVYVSLSIWAFIEYNYSKNKKWIYLIGVFSGFAILCKWLVGLLIYSGWVILILQDKKNRFLKIKELIISFSITIVVSLPWQLYTFLKYPIEATKSYAHNVNHFLEPLEDHDGNIFFYFIRFNKLYGAFALILIIPSFIIFYNNMKDKKMFFSLIGMVIMIYIFFTIAATKMISFPLVTALIIYLAFAALIEFILKICEKHIIQKPFVRKFSFVFVLTLVIFRFNIEGLQAKHTLWKIDNSYSRTQAHIKEIFKSLNLPGNSVLFNIKDIHYIEAMFYTGLPAYSFIPTAEQCSDLKFKKRMIVVFNAGNDLPKYFKNDPSIIILQQKLDLNK